MSKNIGNIFIWSSFLRNSYPYLVRFAHLNFDRVMWKEKSLERAPISV